MNIVANDPTYFVVDASTGSVQRRTDVPNDGGWRDAAHSLVYSEPIACTGPLTFSCKLSPPVGGAAPIMYFGVAHLTSGGTWHTLYRFQIDGSLFAVSNDVTISTTSSLVHTDGDSYEISVTSGDVRFVRNGVQISTGPAVSGVTQVRFEAYMRTPGLKLTGVTLVAPSVTAGTGTGTGAGMTVWPYAVAAAVLVAGVGVGAALLLMRRAARGAGARKR